MSHVLTLTPSRMATALLGLIVTAAAPAATLRVPGDYPTLQAAVDAAAEGDHVLVSSGTYKKVTIENKNIELSSVSGPELTILDGVGDSDSMIGLYNTSSHVHGFTVTHGVGHVFGGGLYIGGGAPLIEDMIITGNDASGGGAAVYMIYTQATLHHNRIVGNATRYYGAGIWTQDSDAVIQDNQIEGNVAGILGGGIEVRGGSRTVLRNVIRGNSSQFGGGIRMFTYLGDRPRFADNLIVGNTAYKGGGVAIMDDDGRSHRSVWVNNTIADNSGSIGHELYTMGVLDVFYNNAIVGDSQGAVYCDGQADADIPVFDHNDVYPGAEGACATAATTGTNLSVPPQFTAGGNGHPYHLAPGSPLVDAGDNENARRLPHDLGKRPRIIDGGHGMVVDIGAYEYRPQ